MEKHSESRSDFLAPRPLPIAVLLTLGFLFTNNAGCATVDVTMDNSIESDTSSVNNTDTESNRTDSSDSDSATEQETESNTEEDIDSDIEDSDPPDDSETESDTERDTSSTDVHCPSYSHGWPCTCKKLILGCDDGSECIGLEGLFDQKTGYCAKSCKPETGLTDCASPYSGLGDCRISDSTGNNYYCAIYCETDHHCPPSQTCQKPPNGLFSVCHP